MNHVCANCVGEPALKNFISDYELVDECEFCGSEEEGLATAPTNEVIDHIVEKILLYYEDPANSVGYDSSEGGYLLPTMDSGELLDDIGLDDLNEQFRETLVERLDNECGIWVRKDPYSSAYNQQLIYDWESFSKLVKHKSRFTFFLSSPRHDRDGDTAVEIPHEVLYLIGSVVDSSQSILSLAKDQMVYRVRQHNPAIMITRPEDIGSPPDAAAKQSRMSPAGVSMFYGALDIATAKEEVDAAAGHHTIGTFRVRRPLALADFKRLGSFPSIFEFEFEAEYEAAVFLSRFAREISQPISRDDRVHIEYVPTQVITEYFRLLYPQKYQKLDGIAFRSSLTNGTNIVLFADKNEWPQMLELQNLERSPASPVKQ